MSQSLKSKYVYIKMFPKTNSIIQIGFWDQDKSKYLTPNGEEVEIKITDGGYRHRFLTRDEFYIILEEKLRFRPKNKMYHEQFERT